MPNRKCEFCQKELREKDGGHYVRNHGMNKKECLIEFKYNGKIPLCACGCGQETKYWQGDFCKFLVGHVARTIKFKEKVKQTSLQKYGVENPSQSPLVRKKIEQNNLKKYGVMCTLMEKNTAEKRNKTMIQKYGTIHALENKIILEKMKSDCLEKYGVDNPSKAKEVIEKIKNVNIEKYGVPWTPMLQSFQENNKKIMLEKYGVSHNSQRPGFGKIVGEKTRKKWDIILEECAHKNYKPLFSPEEYVNHNVFYWFYCNKHNFKFQSTMGNISNKKTIQCPKCKHYNVSKMENELADFIQSFYPNEIIRNNRKVIYPKELDIFLPKLNLAFEFNGRYWHSENEKDPGYHENKTKLCQEKGIQLIHIWEQEWREKQEQIKENIKTIIISRT